MCFRDAQEVDGERRMKMEALEGAHYMTGWCWLRGHKWVEHRESFRGRRNLNRWNSDHTAMIIESGPEEEFHRGLGCDAPAYRDCERCGKRQIQLEKWGWC